jgi:squalene-associated FAD-dependent desaturase
MPKVIVAGGGLAGMAATAALAGAGYDVELFEARPYLGGRATSYAIPSSDGTSETIDNCQHILLRCCVNLLDFYSRLGVTDLIRFHREFYFIEPGGRISVFGAGGLPAPLHFTGAFLRLRYLSVSEKLALARGLLALRSEYGHRKDLRDISMADWLQEKRQPARVVERFWRQILVSAINEELDRMAAAWGFQVFWLGFLSTSSGYEMGIPATCLGDLYATSGWSRFPSARLHLRSPVESLSGEGVRSDSRTYTADYYISALPFERAEIAGLPLPSEFEHSPITGIHLWFDRPVTDLPHATLLDRTLQWMFNKDGGRYIQLVVSASRTLVPMDRNQILDLALRELAEFFPKVSDAKVMRFHVVKEVRATFAATPGLVRPPIRTDDPRVFRAGDWADSGWPSTMEGAVRSGYMAAEAVTAAAGDLRRFLVPDIA